MKQEEGYDFNWLPGFQEMTACQEEHSTQKQVSQEYGGTTAASTAGKPVLAPELLQQEEDAYWKDYEYFLSLLPQVAREIWAVADALLDQYEYTGSSMYAEFPAQTALEKIGDAVYDKMKYYEETPTMANIAGDDRKNPYYLPADARDRNSPLRNLIFVLIGWNMSYRRQRYQRRQKIFHSPNLM